jgi:hypothetical protein
VKATDHADLDRVDADVIGDGVDLREHHFSGIGWTARDALRVLAVMAVTAVIAWPPSMVIVLMSAWIPAPPPLSDPAMTRTRAIMDRSPKPYESSESHGCCVFKALEA